MVGNNFMSLMSAKPVFWYYNEPECSAICRLAEFLPNRPLPTMKNLNRAYRCLFFFVVVFVSTTTTAAEAPIDFEKQIRPILIEECYGCHSAKKQNGSLRLDIRDLAFDGGATGKAILPGKGAKSLLIERLQGKGEGDQMPAKAEALSDAKIALISKWIDQGANWPASADAAIVKPWSFMPPVRPAAPKISQTNWPRNPIDTFILARIEKEGMVPSPEASKETLLRRVHLDLTGLPPDKKAINAFLTDKSPQAYEAAVDRLLASPHYGERWARHWLDNARYADSNGYAQDNPRSIWPYRDWVIKAFNDDMPFDQFTTEQLAGDLLPNATISQKIATGFHRNTQINEEGGVDQEQFRIESIFDRVGTTGAVFLGLTVGCSQCHNHKFDPISQREYYRMFAFFNSCDEPKIPVINASDPRRQEEVRNEIKGLERDLKAELTGGISRLPKWEADLSPEQINSFETAVQNAIRVAPAKRTAKQRDLIVELMMSKDSEYQRKTQRRASLKLEADGVTTLVMAERKTPRDTFIFIKGDFTRPSDQVTPGTPASLHAFKSSDPKNPNRIDFANWITDPSNPLTARVQMNRFWMHYFGKGLVETENDFGTQGSKPVNPELLDWLATEFVAKKWSMKAMHRVIVTSATYRQSSNISPDLREKDPLNRLHARQNRVRLDAEVVRDVALTASGLLVNKIGGPSVFPPQPEGVTKVGQVKREWQTSVGEDRYRRGLYTWLWRLSPHPLLTSFDGGEATQTCTRRNRSNTPLQALQLLNDDAFIEFAQGLAGRVTREMASRSSSELIRHAFQLCTGRIVQPDELKILETVFAQARGDFEKCPQDAKIIAGGRTTKGFSEPVFAAYVMTCRVILNLDETITRE